MTWGSDAFGRTTNDGEVLFTLQEAAKKLSVPVGTLYSWASRGEISPTSVAPGGKALYRLAELQRRADATTRRRSRGARDA